MVVPTMFLLCGHWVRFLSFSFLLVWRLVMYGGKYFSEIVITSLPKEGACLFACCLLIFLYPRSVISIFVVRYLDSIIPILA